MKFNFLRLISVLMIAGGLMLSCRSNVDLANVDTTSEVSWGLIVPVGSFKMSIGDFFNADSIPEMYLETVDGDTNVITFKYNFEYGADFHDVDLSTKISSGVFNMNVYDRIKALGLIAPDGYVYGAGIPITIDFPLTLQLTGINTDTSDERLDSAWIESASFVSKIYQQSMDSLLWGYVDSILMDLGERIHRPKGQRMVVYQKNPMGTFVKDYGVPLNTDVDNFTLCMMKDPHIAPPADYKNNVLDKCEFHIYITLNIPVGKRVFVPETAAFVYDLGVQFIDYTAIWGMYAPSGEVTGAHDTIDLSSVWETAPFLANATFPFTNPQISTTFGSHLAGAVSVKFNNMFSTDKEGNVHQALFNGTSHDFVRNFNKPGEYLDPITSAFDDTISMRFTFDNTPEGGEINRLFAKTPYTVGYNFSLSFDQLTTPQIRITPNTDVRFSGDIHLPMAFAGGLNIQYTDTAPDVDISQISIDSLMREDGAIVVDSLKNTTNIKLFLKSESTIPFRLKVVLRLLDEDHNIINDPETGLPMSLFDGDTLKIDPPTVSKNGDGWTYTPKESTIVATLTASKLKQLPEAKAILYYVSMDTEWMKEASTLEGFSAKLMTQEYVKFNIGLTAQLDAIVHFNTGNNGNNQ